QCGVFQPITRIRCPSAHCHILSDAIGSHHLRKTMRLSRIGMVESMRLDRIVPVAAPAPHILYTGSTTKETFHAHLRHRRFGLDRLGPRRPTPLLRPPGARGTHL